MSKYFFYNLLRNKFKLLPIICIVQMIFFCSNLTYSQIPEFDWAKSLGGFTAMGMGVDVDPAGNVYSVGYFRGGGDFDPGSGTFNMTSMANTDGYISKLDRHGDFVWAKQIGGTDWEQAVDVTVDSQNNIYVIGHFKGTVNFGSISLSATGLFDIYVCKLDELGNFLWAKAMHGVERNDNPHSIATDSQNNVVITGGFKGTVDFDPGPGTFNLTSLGALDIFVAKLDPSGNFLWAKEMGGINGNSGKSITVDGSDNIVLTGSINGAVDFNGVSLTTVDNSTDIFVCKLASDGTQLWVKQFEGVFTSTYMGGSPANPILMTAGSSGVGNGVVTDNSGNVYTTGYYKGNVDFDPGAGTFFIPSVDSINEDIFISKLDDQGDFVWAKMIGNTEICQALGIDVNTLGNVYITGRFYGTLDFDPSPSGTNNLSSGYTGGGSDAFIGVLDFNGDFVWAGQFMGSDTHINISNSIKVDDIGRIYTTGYFGYGVDFDPGANVYIMSTPAPNSSTSLAFVHKMADTLIASFTTSDNTICEGESITFTDESTGMGILSWNWIFEGGTPATANTQGPHTVDFNTAGIYNITLEIEDDLGDTDDTVVVITVNPIPTATAGATSLTLCEGEDIELTAGSVSGATYSWTGPDGYSNGTQNPIILNASISDGGTYTLTVTNNGCIAEDDVVITVNPKPTFTLGSTDPTTCGGTEGTITISGLDASTTYAISYEDDGTSVGPASMNSNGSGEIVITGLNAGDYTNFLVDLASCSGTNLTVITLVEFPGPTVGAGIDQTVCEGTEVTLTASNPDGATISWDPGVTDGTSFPATSTQTYTVTAELSGCTSTDEVVVTVNPIPIFTVSSTNPSCGNTDGEIIIILVSGSPTTNYSIDNGTTTQSSGTFSSLDAGNYTVYVEDNGCVSTQLVSLSNSGAPTIDNIAVTQTSCTANDGTITISALGGTAPIEYSIDNGVSFQGSGSFTGLGAGNYDIVVKDDNGCEASGTAMVIQMNTPSLTLVSSDDASCFGEDDGSAEISATGGTAPYSYDWTPVGGNATTATDLAPGTYTVEVEDDAGCSDQIQITISEPDEITIDETITKTDCGLDNGEIILHVTGGTGNYTYAWNPNVSTSDVATDLATGTYEVTVTDDNGCSKIISYDIILGNSFYIEATPDSVTIVQGESTGINLFVDPNIVVDSIIWTPSDGLSCSDCKDPIATPENSTTYIVRVTDDKGCTSTDTVEIIVVLPCPDIFVPNTFSPNGDGLNDAECVLGDCIQSMEFTIYNRWGEPVFYSKDQKECWDGTYKGKLVQSGVYVYKLKATLDNGNQVDETGNVTVVR